MPGQHKHQRFISLNNLPTATDIASGLKFLAGIPSLLRHCVTSEEAHAALQHRLQNREIHFLTLAQEAIYNNPVSPYRTLLKLAGCEFGDLETLVRKDGIEETLRILLRRGVYLTVGEAKGREPVVRGSTKFEIRPKQLAKPRVAGELISESGGSRGSRTPVPIDLELDRIRSAEVFLDFEARQGLDWVRAIWAVPGTASLRRAINYTLCGTPPERWFSVLDPTATGLHPRYVWSTRALRLGGLFAGIRIPRLCHVPLHEPMPILHWMLEILQSGRTPQLYTYPSCAVRLCQAALAAGISLEGAQFLLGGEPMTAPRLAVIEGTGATAHVQYGSVETDTLGRGCLFRDAPDDLHVTQDRLAVIQPENFATQSLPASALLITSIFLPVAKLILLNVSLGDQCEMDQRICGCPLEKLGWKTHLRHIRSFEKLTAGGMTFLDADLIRALEQSLPSRFGGGPTDYQLLEEETDDGIPRVRLLVHPRLGALDAAEIRSVFLEEIGKGSGVERVMMSVWRDAGLPIVAREAPRMTGAGKILHVHVERQPSRAARPLAD